MLALCSAMLMGCQAHDGSVASPEQGRRYSRILVFPFINVAEVFGIDQTVQGPLSGKVFVTFQMDPRAEQYMTSEATRQLARRISPESVIVAHDIEPGMNVMPGAQHRRQLISRLRKAGRQYGADAVLIGYLYGFKERVGGNYGVDSPAKISFELNLIGAANGNLVWQNQYTETQKALNENLFQLGKFIQRKGRWITAQEMAAYALEEMFRMAGAF